MGKKAQPNSYQYIVRFRWRALDEARLRQVIERNFGPADISIEKQPSHATLPSSRPSRKPPAPGSLAARILELFQERKSWRLSEIQAALAKRNVSNALGDLMTGGEVVKAGWGLYVLAGTVLSPERPLSHPRPIEPESARGGCSSYSSAR